MRSSPLFNNGKLKETEIQLVRHTYGMLPSVARYVVDHPERRDRFADRSLTHLVGLNFSRSWCLSHIAEAVRQAERRGRALKLGDADHLEAMAAQHLAAALPLAVSGGWMGDHWLHTFAMRALQACTPNFSTPNYSKESRLEAKVQQRIKHGRL